MNHNTDEQMKETDAHMNERGNKSITNIHTIFCVD